MDVFNIGIGFKMGGNGDGGTPAISALKVQNTGYGTPIQICYGANRVSPLLGWTANFKAEKHENAGGKGGGASGTGAFYTYTSDVLLFLCEGPIDHFGKLWRNKEKHNTTTPAVFNNGKAGSYSQVPWDYIASTLPAQALGYRGIAYISSSNYPLQDGGTLGNHSVEVFGRLLSTASGAQNAVDVHIKDAINDFINNDHYGVVDSNTTNIVLETGQMHAYCQARNLLISPLLSQQKPASDWLKDWATVANAAVVWSEGKLKFLPYADQGFSNSFATYTPDTTIRFNFNDDNVSEPVKPTRKKPADAYNKVSVEYLNRANDYNKQVVEVKDDASIESEGLRPANKLTIEAIKTGNVAMIVAHTLLLQGLYIRNTYTIKTFCNAETQLDLLEPLDFVTLTDADLGLDRFRCRVVSVEDEQDGNMTLIVEEAPVGIYNG